jgi:hypothetical protein
MAEMDNGWRFAQCFGDKGDVDEFTEGEFDYCGVPGQFGLLIQMSGLVTLIFCAYVSISDT